jgi:hypothetical protein
LILSNPSLCHQPIGLAVVKLIFVVLLPIILLVSALRVDVFVRLVVFYFAISFLTVIWAVAAFIDNNIMNILTGSPREEGNNPFV